MWVLLGTSLPKIIIMSILCGVVAKNRRHQDTVQKKANIHGLVTGQRTLCDANSHITQSKTRTS